MNLYANLAQKHKAKKDKDARERAEYLATLPKHPVKRFFYRLHPKRLAKYWFSKRGGLMALKILGVGILLMLLLIGGMFAYFRKDLDKIRPGELASGVKRLSLNITTATTICFGKIKAQVIINWLLNLTRLATI